MKNLPKISVIIPSYNKAKYIGSTLASIFDQKYPNLEVIVQDGGSDDGTLSIIKKFAKIHPVHLETGKDNGQLDAVNKGLHRATGEIATFINADDTYIDKTFAAVAEAYTKHSDKSWFAGKGIVVDKDGKEIAKLVTWYKNFLFSLNSRIFLLMTNYLIQPSVFFTLKAYNEYGPFSGTADFITEYDLWLKLSGQSMPYIIDKRFSKFRIEAATKTKTMFKSLLAQDEKIIAKFTKNPLILLLHKLNNFGRVVVGRML